MANTQVRVRSPKGNVGVTDVVDAGELSAYSMGALSGFDATSAASWTLQIGGSSTVQDVAIGRNPAGESELFVGTSATTVPFIIGGAPGTPGQSRTDALVLYKDPNTTSVVNNGLDITDYAVVAGTPATTGTQVPPSMATIRSTIPTGTLKSVAVIGYVTIAYGAGSVTTGNFYKNPALLGTQVVANATARALITPVEGMRVYQADIDSELVYQGSRWKWIEAPHRLGQNLGADVATITASYVTYATVTATSLGGVVEIDYSAWLYDGSSGAARTFSIKVQCDGVDVGTPLTTIGLPYISGQNPGAGIRSIVSHTPSAGSHTWTVQALASAASAVGIRVPLVIVNEIS